jgi:hypothetical protein
LDESRKPGSPAGSRPRPAPPPRAARRPPRRGNHCSKRSSVERRSAVRRQAQRQPGAGPR